MISDHSVPPDHQPAEAAERAEPPRYTQARWTAAEIHALAQRLDRFGREALAAVSDQSLLAAWDRAIALLLDPASASRRRLDPALAVTCRLSPEALQAALEAMLEGMTGDPARRLFERAATLERRHRGLVTAVLPANVPALAAQVLLPALALRRPVLLKSSSREPLLGAALVHLLGRTEPPLAEALAAVTWRGGDSELEAAAFADAETVVAFGSDDTLRSLEARRSGVVGHGTRISVAVVSADADLPAASAGLAEDIALFEQRGCLSVRSILTDADADALSAALAEALRRQARRWPPVPLDRPTASALRLARSEAELHGSTVADLPLDAGTVIVRSGGPLDPLPAARSVRIHRLGEVAQALDLLAPWRGRIQGAAVAGERAERLRGELEALEVRRITAPGDLQRTDALWANGDRHLIERLA
jgi:hypothetical protein